MRTLRRLTSRAAHLKPDSVPHVVIWMAMRLIPGSILGSGLAVAPAFEDAYIGGWNLVTVGIMAWIAGDVLTCAKPEGGQCFYCFSRDTWLVYAVPRWWRMLPSRWDGRYVCDEHFMYWHTTHPGRHL